jgi:hypothetical protein
MFVQRKVNTQKMLSAEGDIKLQQGGEPSLRLTTLRGTLPVTSGEICFFEASGSEALDYADGSVTPRGASKASIPLAPP